MNPARAEAAARVLPTFANARGQARFSSRRDTTRAKVCAGVRARPEASRRQKARNDEGRAMGQSTRAKSSVLAGSFAHKRQKILLHAHRVTVCSYSFTRDSSNSFPKIPTCPSRKLSSYKTLRQKRRCPFLDAHSHAVDVPHNRSTMRSLLGGAKEALVHDPGAEGPEGEGEAAMTMLVIVYAVALGLIIYGTHPPSQLTVTFGRASPRPRPTPELTTATPRRSSRRSGRTRAPRGAPRATPPGATPPLVPPPKQREKRIKKTREKKFLSKVSDCRCTRKGCICPAFRSRRRASRSNISLTGALSSFLFSSLLFIPPFLLFAFLPLPRDIPPLRADDSTEKFVKKDHDHDALQAAELADVENFKAKLASQKA